MCEIDFIQPPPVRQSFYVRWVWQPGQSLDSRMRKRATSITVAQPVALHCANGCATMEARASRRRGREAGNRQTSRRRYFQEFHQEVRYEERNIQPTNPRGSFAEFR